MYELLQSSKFEYGKKLKWLIPFPGDFHYSVLRINEVMCSVQKMDDM